MKIKSNEIQFDERQILIRGNGFKIAFLILMFMTALNFIYEGFAAQDSALSISIYTRAMLCVWIPTVIVSIYFIINGAYEKANEKGSNILPIAFIFPGLALTAGIIVGLVEGEINWFQEHDAYGNLIAAVCMTAIGIAFIIKKKSEAKDFEDEN